jgi:hypothetical protein
MEHIYKRFPISETEYLDLNAQFGRLCEHAAWELIRKNVRNNHTDNQEDVAQELRISLLRAGSYYKRQVYLESCLKLCWDHSKTNLILRHVVAELKHLWLNKTHHGANRQKFGPYQEKLLAKMVKLLVPPHKRPSRRAPLKIDLKFRTYCKTILWNAQKNRGKKITKEKAIRTGLVSLSNFDYLGSTN